MKLVTGALALALAGAACGGDDDSISKADYVEQANEFCEEALAEYEEAVEPLGDQPSDADIREFAGPLVDLNRDLIEFLEEEPRPEGDDEEIDSIVEGSKDATDELEDDPVGVFRSGENPYADVNAQMTDYGMTSCTD